MYVCIYIYIYIYIAYYTYPAASHTGQSPAHSRTVTVIAATAAVVTDYSASVISTAQPAYIRNRTPQARIAFWVL